MCGIAGIWHLSGEKLEPIKLKRFTDSMAHRGPDGSGYSISEETNLGFGHRRLSILDLSEGGKQPMIDHGGNRMITYNGEVYNFIELRQELEKLGKQFKTESDTEVILEAYDVWGMSCFSRFNGMFAIAIWDKLSRELLLARDRFGVKPLYYLNVPGRIFAFASETIAFKALDDFDREVEPEHFALALHSPELLEGSERTLFRHIYQLQAGCALKISPSPGIRIKRWWSTSDTLHQVPERYEEQVMEFIGLFEDACRIRMRSDVNIASALSGGLDSSSVYTTLHKISANNEGFQRIPGSWQKAFVATFPGTSMDERIYAEQVVAHCRGEAVYINSNQSDLVEQILKSTHLFDGIITTPIVSISDIYANMRQNGIRVSLDGHGVDEMMYGYNTYVNTAFYQYLSEKNWDAALGCARVLCGLSPAYRIERFEQLIKLKQRGLVTKLIHEVKNKLQRGPEKVVGPEVKTWLPEVNTSLANAISLQYVCPYYASEAETQMYADFHYLSLPINLRDFDRAAMQHGIEIRMPFMDYRLVSYVFSLPPESKLGNGFTKRILRDAMKGTLPENIRTRKYKVGIGAPMTEWFNGPLKPFIFDMMNSQSFSGSLYWDAGVLRTEVEKAYKRNSMDKQMAAKIWTCLNANIILNGY